MPKKNKGAAKVRAGNRVLFEGIKARDRKRLAARNAARRAAGLPEIKSP